MFDRQDLRAAVEADVISADVAARLEAFLVARNDADRGLGSENLRFLTNLNDIFITIGLIVLFIGASIFSGTVFGQAGPNKGTAYLILLPLLALAWGLAEYFTGRRRLLLPSMALSVIIVSIVSLLAVVTFAPDRTGDAFDIDVGLRKLGYGGIAGAGLAALAVYLRFRLPFSLLLLALAVAGLLYLTLLQFDAGGKTIAGVGALAVGLATLAAGVWFDARDPQRATRLSDNAFWLHFAAAPQIMLGVRGLISGGGFEPGGPIEAMVMLAVLIGFGLFSLATNRRALIVSGLVSFAGALGVLVREASGGGVNAVMITLLVVGGAIVLLGGGWRTARRGLLAVLPRGGAFDRVFPPEPVVAQGGRR